jgi:hypothetical protein
VRVATFPLWSGTSFQVSLLACGMHHRYAIDENRLIVTAKIVPPTSQNQKRIEDDLREYAAQLAAWPLEEAT